MLLAYGFHGSGRRQQQWAVVRRMSGSFRPVARRPSRPSRSAAVFAMMPKIGGEFIPPSETGVVSGSIKYPVGTPLATTAGGLERLGAQIQKFPDVSSSSSRRRAARSSGFANELGGNVAQFTVVSNKEKRWRDEQRRDGDPQARLDGAGRRTASRGGRRRQPLSFTLTGPDAQLNEAAEKLAT